MDLFTARHKVVHNGGSLNLKGLLFDKKTKYLAQILQSLSYKVCSIILPKFNTFGLFIRILGTSAIMDQAACCYNVTTSETGLYGNQALKVYHYVQIKALAFLLQVIVLQVNFKITCMPLENEINLTKPMPHLF